jgi:hypothetical protein
MEGLVPGRMATGGVWMLLPFKRIYYALSCRRVTEVHLLHCVIGGSLPRRIVTEKSVLAVPTSPYLRALVLASGSRTVTPQ